VPNEYEKLQIPTNWTENIAKLNIIIINQILPGGSFTCPDEESCIRVNEQFDEI
jgi:hypothetical protein